MSETGALNLARRPFVNARPVARVAALLWVLGALLLAANVFLFWSYLAGSGEQRARLSRIDAEIRRNQERTAQLETEVSGLDLARQNERVLFLNEKIAERTFSWSQLFDRMAEVLPRDVRLTRLTPATASEQARGGGARRRSWRQRAGSSEVTLTIAGEAKTDEALSQLIENLFGHPAFDEPNLSHESKNEETGRITFDLQVGYLPAAAMPPAGAEPGPAVTVEEEPLPGQPGEALPGQPSEPPPGQQGEAAPPTGGAR